MAPIISSYNPGGVDEATLTGTGRGGILSDGFLRDDPIGSYLGADEQPVFVVPNEKKGVTFERLDGDDEERIRPGDGYRAFAVATDSRLVFLVGATDDRDGGDHSVSIPLADVEVVERTDGVLTSELAVTTAADERWRFPTRRDLDRVVEYLDAASMTWMDVERRLEAARQDVVEASTHLESTAYDDAMAAVRDAMAETDAARRCERTLCEDGVRAIGSRIERMEGRITDVRVRALESRAANRIDAAEAHWRDGEYDAAHDAFGNAHDDYVEALTVGDLDFEESKGLREKLARVERNVDSLERAPVERGDQYRGRAHEADDPAETADRLELALECYRSALELDWGRTSKRFDGETGEIRDRIDAVARTLVETRRRLASQRVKRGDELADAGRRREARERYREAVATLEDTAEPASELVPDALEDLTDHLAVVERRLEELEPNDDQTPIP